MKIRTIRIVTIFFAFVCSVNWTLSADAGPCSGQKVKIFHSDHVLTCTELPFLEVGKTQLQGKYVSEITWGGTLDWGKDDDVELLTPGLTVTDPAKRFDFSEFDPRINATSAYVALTTAGERIRKLSNITLAPIKLHFTDLRCRFDITESACQKNYGFWGRMGRNSGMSTGTHGLKNGKVDLWILIHEYVHHLQYQTGTIETLSKPGFDEGLANVIASLLLEEPRTGKMRLLKEFELDFSKPQHYPEDIRYNMFFENIPIESRQMAESQFPDILAQWKEWFGNSLPQPIPPQPDLTLAEPYQTSAVYGSVLWRIAKKSSFDAVLMILLRLSSNKDISTKLTSIPCLFAEVEKQNVLLNAKIDASVIRTELEAAGIPAACVPSH